MSTQARPSTASTLSLIGGIFIVLGSLVSVLVSFFWGPWGWGMMGPWMMGVYGFGYGFAWVFSLVGLVAGLIVITGAIMLQTRPAEHMFWGTLVLIFSIVSFVGMGGFMIGALLGIAGGALALIWRPRST
ncbi:MAG: hypothetical protein FJ045_01840 [Crenarchaeota archaeon]|nr:hypothetical protein [Thermoproteota archaeon]